MDYYYSIRGDAARHGVASLSQLQKMAAQGELRPVDLVWRIGSGTTWVPASEIKKIFPDPEPEPAPEVAAPPPVEESRPSKKAAAPKAKKSAASKSSPVGAVVAVLVLIAFIGGGYVVWKKVMGGAVAGDSDSVATVTTTTTTTTQPAPPVDYEAKLSEAESLIQSGKLNDALPVTLTLITHDDYRVRALALSADLPPDQQWVFRAKQVQALITKGTMAPIMARDLVRDIIAMGKKTELVAMMEAIMAKPANVSPPTCEAVVLLMRALRMDAHSYRMLMSYTQHCVETNNEEGVVTGARLLAEQDSTDEALAKLNKYLSVHPDALEARIELAAVLALTGEERRALDELKTGMDINEKRVKQAARSDARFDPMRNSWSFKRLVKD